MIVIVRARSPPRGQQADADADADAGAAAAPSTATTAACPGTAAGLRPPALVEGIPCGHNNAELPAPRSYRRYLRRRRRPPCWRSLRRSLAVRPRPPPPPPRRNSIPSTKSGRPVPSRGPRRCRGSPWSNAGGAARGRRQTAAAGGGARWPVPGDR